ncbi:MAG: DEAD/DEAH box helicase [Deltaproteobacteria bacterium]|nr:DEAD/DEAH box helicase [Deltaproteobacteria bacterium]
MTEERDFQQTSQRAEVPKFLTSLRFDHLDLYPQVLAGLKDAGLTFCTPIQAEVLPLTLAGKDVAGQAQTGTGKTAAFLVTVLNRLISLPDRRPEIPSALIVAPTRELAVQIYDDAKVLGGHTGFTVAQVMGGLDYEKQADILRKGADIVICTPGRIIDYLKQGIFKTEGIKALVIDEADRLFDLGFTKDMRYILKRLPHYEKRLSMLFSATLSYKILALTYDYMNLPEFIAVTPEEVTAEGIEQSLFHVSSQEKLPLLLGLLERESWHRVLIFTNTKADVEWLTGKLRGNGLAADGITGDLPQRNRLSLMARFKGGSIKILVATDVASRGIHVEDISHIINYDLPQNAENYIHRIGRTARAGKRGKAISLACEECVFHLEPIEELLGSKIPVVWPQEDWFKEDKAGKVPRKAKEKTEWPKTRPPREEKAGPPAGRWKSIAFSTQPGGIFGLAVQIKGNEPEKTPEGEVKKKRKRKWGRSKKKPVAQVAA